jgi:hypothetical protein
MAELDARSNKAARQRIEVGASNPIKFSFTNDDNDQVISTIELPEDSFVNMLHFLDGHELAVASLVNKAWLSSIRLPIVWEEGFDMSRLNSKKVLNMGGLLKLLQQPQFANVKAFALPQKVKLGMSGVKQLAKTLPHLEILDISNVKAQDSDLLLAAEHFPNLNSLHTDMWNVTSGGIAQFSRAAGHQLVDLRILGESITRNHIASSTMDAITSSCPNLKYFAYRSCSVLLFYKPYLDGMRGDKVVALVRACRHLETLELVNTYAHVNQSHFVEIAELVANDLETYALRNIIACNSYGIHPKPEDDTTDEFNICDVLANYTFLNVQDKFSHPRLGKGVMFWGRYYHTNVADL